MYARACMRACACAWQPPGNLMASACSSKQPSREPLRSRHKEEYAPQGQALKRGSISPPQILACRGFWQRWLVRQAGGRGDLRRSSSSERGSALRFFDKTLRRTHAAHMSTSMPTRMLAHTQHACQYTRRQNMSVNVHVKLRVRADRKKKNTRVRVTRDSATSLRENLGSPATFLLARTRRRRTLARAKR